MEMATASPGRRSAELIGRRRERGVLDGLMLYRLDRLPSPQAGALGVASGIAPGSAPDRFVLGLAVLNLLSDAAEEQPLLVIHQADQWLLLGGVGKQVQNAETEHEPIWRGTGCEAERDA